MIFAGMEGATAKQPQPNPLLDDIEAATLGAALPGGACRAVPTTPS